MAYLQTKNEVTLNLQDDEGRKKRKTFEIDNAFTNTDAIAQNYNDCMRGAVTDYIYRQKQAFDGSVDFGTVGDVNDITNLIFELPNKERYSVQFPYLAQACFVATTGPNARIVKDLATLQAGVVGSPEAALAGLIGYYLSGEILAAGQVVDRYIEGYKAD